MIDSSLTIPNPTSNPIPNHTSIRNQVDIQVICQGYHPEDGRRLSIVLQADLLMYMKDFWAESCVAVADCFGISCRTRPWLADEVKWEALDVLEGIELSTILYERDVPSWYWDGNRTTLGMRRKNTSTIKTIARLLQDYVMMQVFYIIISSNFSSYATCTLSTLRGIFPIGRLYRWHIF
jgi:hypothetical protein